MNEARWILELLGGDSRTVELPLAGTLVIGASRERAGFVVEGQGVDEAHCAIGRTRDGDWGVKDLGSRHGTHVNGQRITAARLKLGDQLVLGSRRLEVKLAPDRTQPAVPAVGIARPADVPERIGGYRIERLIGRGGMGAVYLAVQESLRRPVALKVLAPKLAADRDFVHRFQAEARAAAALSHPNVVVVYDVGEEQGAHYLSMEFMAGGSLEQKLAASGPLPWKAVLSVLADAAGGLAYAESRGIVHRDVKPANLMYSGTGTVKIADLGLATTIEQEASEAVDGRKVFGTPHFISPEQARGAAVDNRSDLYSLGATAYRLLSGHTPYEGATTREILRALQTEDPVPLRELVPDLSPELDALVAKLMQKDPAARFPTAEALRRECERLRLVAEHGSSLAVERGSRAQLAIAIGLLVVVGGATAAWFLLGDDAPAGGGRDPRPALAGETADDAAPDDDATFLAGEREAPAELDEEAQLREREREASRELRELSPALDGADRERALEGIVTRFAGTAAAATAERELAALRAPPDPPGSTGPTLAEAVADLEARLAKLPSDAPLAARLAAIDAYRPPPAHAAELEARRASLAAEAVGAAEADVRARLDRATELAVEGRFDDVRAGYAELETRLADLDAVPGDPARLAGLRALRDDLAARVGRVAEEERFHRERTERARRRALGEALGPGSGLLAELGALDFAALERRLTGLAPELAGRPFATLLAAEVAHAKAAIEMLSSELAAGRWRRKALVDPRAKRVGEVRDMRLAGIVFDGASEVVPWRHAKSDPEWWNQLFQARLDRDYTPAEARHVVGLLRVAGATRGAELAREGIDPRSRGAVSPTELDELARVFEPAATWLDAAAADDALRAALERERRAAVRLGEVLRAAQSRAWSVAAAHLETLLAAPEPALMIGLLSDGADWSVAPPLPVASTDRAPSNGSGAEHAPPDGSARPPDGTPPDDDER